MLMLIIHTLFMSCVTAKKWDFVTDQHKLEFKCEVKEK